MKIKIKNRYSGEVIFAHECENNSIKKTVEKAVELKTNLRWANLRGVDLRGADLRWADLRWADLEGAKNIYIFTAYDTSNRIVYCIRHENTWMVKAGCFWGDLDELEERVKATHDSPVYLANIELLRKLL